MKIIKVFNKKINRIERLSDYRRINDLTNNHVGNFEIEVSPKAKKNIDRKIYFSLEHDFKDKDNKNEMYWIRFNNECNDIKTDFNYNVIGYIRNGQHRGLDDWGVTIVMEHIDSSMKWGQLRVLVHLISKWIDKKYGNDCGFKDNYNFKDWQFDYITNKKI
jgi:hypothetical protein